MRDLLDSQISNCCLSLGNYSFSPVVQFSTSLVLRHADFVHENGINELFLITLPYKKDFSLWISVQYLINAFLKECISQHGQRINELNLKRGSKIEIFSSVGIYEGINSSGKLIVTFSDGARAHITPQNFQFVNRTKRKSINKFNLYSRRKRKFLKERKALTKILDLDSNPNFGAIKSKIVLVSGKGNVGKFRKLLRNIKVYDEGLDEVVLLDSNFIIAPDLTYFDGLVVNESTNEKDFFKGALKTILEQINSVDSSINELIIEVNDLSIDKLRTQSFVQNYQKLISVLFDHEETVENANSLKGLFSHYPGIEEDILSDVSLVVINDIQSLNDFRETVLTIRKRNVPIIAISDRFVFESQDLDFYKILLQTSDFKNSFRFNWDNSKLKDLELQLDNGSKYLDYRFNNLCYRNSIQQVVLCELESNEFDEIYSSFETSGLFVRLSNFELLQKAYYKLLRPLLYVLKNSNESYNNEELLFILSQFESIYNASSAGIDNSDKSLIENNVQRLKNYIHDGKIAKNIRDQDLHLFHQDISAGDYSFTLPKVIESSQPSHNNEINEVLESIGFLGFPYREYNFKYLSNSIFVNIVPRVDVFLNKCEFQLTKRFLYKRILAGYYFEHFPDDFAELDPWKVDTDEKLWKLVNSFFKILEISDASVDNTEIDELESLEDILNNVRYSDYGGNSNREVESHSYTPKCDVLHFENGLYFFLPHTRRVLTLKETDKKAYTTQNCMVDQLSPGDTIIQIDVSRRSISDFLEDSGKLDSDLETLNSWRAVLVQEYEKNGDLDVVRSKLQHNNQKFNFGGNPEKHNIIRWLHDESLLAPAPENLMMILALNSTTNIEDQTQSIIHARQIVINAKNRLDRAVKRILSDLMSDSYTEKSGEFTLQLNGIDVKARKAEIIGIERRNDLLIEYQSTMKIIDDLC